MMTEPDCDCRGCVYEDGACYWPREGPPEEWSPDALDPIELPPRVVGLIEELRERNAPDRVNSDPES